MKLVKLDDNFNINYGYLIEEGTKEGCIQHYNELLRYHKNKDKYNINEGINWSYYIQNISNLLTDNRIKNNLIYDIKKQISKCPYTIKLLEISFTKEYDKINILLKISCLINNKQETIELNKVLK